jgi:hypothetical protein
MLQMIHFKAGSGTKLNKKPLEPAHNSAHAKKYLSSMAFLVALELLYIHTLFLNFKITLSATK